VVVGHGGDGPVPSQARPHRVLELRECERDPTSGQLRLDLVEDRGGRRVDVGDRLGRDDDPADRLRRFLDPSPDPIAERVGVGEEQRGVEPIEEQPRDLAGVRVIGQVVVALDPIGATQDRIVWRPRMPAATAPPRRTRPR
jgi:hypothetical protein